MIRFNNDYNRGALDSILSALTAANADSFAGYGEDIWCQRAETVIKQLVSSGDALIKFVPGATQANLVVIAAALSPSTEPKFPCPSTSGYRIFHSCASLTIASYTELSP